MSGITLSASVRQNLLSLQSTADLLSTTQSRLSTGNKVNSALDNPTNFFTAQGLNNRASDINNLLDGIGNGVQILQAANTGITSLQKLVDSAKSIANQALQATTGYSTKSQVKSAIIPGATADNLLGGTTVPETPAASGSTTAAAVYAGAEFTADTATPANNDTLTIDGTVVTFDGKASNGTTDIADTAGGKYTIDEAIEKINGALTAASKTITATKSADGKIVLTNSATGVASNFDVAAGTTNKGGFAASTTTTNGADLIPASTTGGLSGQTLTIQPTGGGATTNITFGSADGQVKTLDQLNTELAKNNMMASLGSDGVLTITTTNDYASKTIGTLGGTAVTGTGNAFNGKTASAPVEDANAQNTRAGLVAQYNTVMDQIKTTAADSSFNGVNLLNGDTLALTFNETGKSKLSITGVTFDTLGLGLDKLTAKTDFLDNSAANGILTKLNDASSKLRSQASAFGSNLSVVQMRQDFSKQMINVLQTGASNLTLADTNQEAANSQALSTRQSIAVSALSLANQSQQGVLQLLR